jgi:hypothetical protein
MEDALDQFINKYFKFFDKGDKNSVKLELMSLCKNVILYMTEQSLVNIHNVFTSDELSNKVSNEQIIANSGFTKLVNNDKIESSEQDSNTESTDIKSNNSILTQGTVSTQLSASVLLTNQIIPLSNVNNIFKFGDKNNGNKGIKLTDKKRGRKRIKPDRRLMTKFICNGVKPSGEKCIKSFYEDNYNGYCHSHKEQYCNDYDCDESVNISDNSDISEIKDSFIESLTNDSNLKKALKCKGFDCKMNIKYKSIIGNYYCEKHINNYLKYDLDMAHKDFIEQCKMII